MSGSFVTEIDAALASAQLEPCCLEDGRLVSHRDFFFGRVRRFRIVCPEGHSSVLRVWAPRGKKWSKE